MLLCITSALEKQKKNKRGAEATAKERDRKRRKESLPSNSGDKRMLIASVDQE
jgi:hypothetical protein